MTTSQPTKRSGAAPDHRLLLDRLERAVVEGKSGDRCREILEREEIWRTMGPADRRRWARLAQMAGMADAALAVLESVNRDHPADTAAWEERLSLLSLLDRREDLAAALAGARPHLGPDRCRAWASRGGRGAGKPADDPGMAAASEPFARMRSWEAAVSRYMALFAGREDCFARQWADRETGKTGYVPVRRALRPGDVEAHLKGRATYGIYLMRNDATVSTAVIDVDLVRDLRNRRLKAAEADRVRRERAFLFSRIRELAGKAGLSPLIEFSGGKGYHFWFFLAPPAPAGRVRAIVNSLAGAVAGDVSAFGLEVFPKQDKLSGKGLGNLVKLPLGIHRLTGKASHFIDVPDRSAEGQLAVLAEVRPADIAGLTPPQDAGTEAVVHPFPRARRDEGLPEDLTALARRCPPLAQVMAACRSGSGPSLREEKVLFSTVGFLPDGRAMLHRLLVETPEYNAHLVDYKAGRVRGTPLGCRRIHALLDFTGDYCRFSGSAGGYAHPLRHLASWDDGTGPPSEKAVNLASALEHLKAAIAQVERFMQ